MEITGDEKRRIATKIKNIISDQASVNKKFVTLLSNGERRLCHTKLVIGNLWQTIRKRGMLRLILFVDFIFL